MDNNEQNIEVNQSGVNQTQERTVEGNTPNSVVPIHLHNGVDSLRIAPSLTRLPVARVTTASTAPTDTAEEGSVRVYQDGTNYYLWTRANKTWQGLSLGTTSMSHVSVNRSASQGITTGDVVIFNNESYDTLSEYHTTTGIFTATNAGYYHVTVNVGSDLLTWTAGKYWLNEISVNSSAVAVTLIASDAALNSTRHTPVTKTVYLSATNTIKAVVRHDLGGSQNTRADATRVYMTIDRIA